MSKNEEQNRSTSREAKIKQDTREIIDTSNGGLHYKVVINSQEECDLSSLQQVFQDNIFCDNYRRNIGGSVGIVVQK